MTSALCLCRFQQPQALRSFPLRYLSNAYDRLTSSFAEGYLLIIFSRCLFKVTNHVFIPSLHHPVAPHTTHKMTDRLTNLTYLSSHPPISSLPLSPPSSTLNPIDSDHLALRIRLGTHFVNIPISSLPRVGVSKTPSS